MEDLVQQFSTMAPEVWDQLVSRVIYQASFAIGFGVVLTVIAGFLFVHGLRIDSYDADIKIISYGFATVLLLIGGICIVFGISDLLYPLGAAAEALVHQH